MRKFSSAHAKNHFGELVDAARLAPVAVTKYDKPFVVVMSADEFERLRAQSTQKYNQKSIKVDLAKPIIAESRSD
jgi:prevent-host-death family protein